LRLHGLLDFDFDFLLLRLFRSSFFYPSSLNSSEFAPVRPVLLSFSNRRIYSTILINTNALIILAPHVVIASPKGTAISFSMGLLRRYLLAMTNYLLRLY